MIKWWQWHQIINGLIPDGLGYNAFSISNTATVFSRRLNKRAIRMIFAIKVLLGGAQKKSREVGLIPFNSSTH